jgi:hypothetical protein
MIELNASSKAMVERFSHYHRIKAFGAIDPGMA